MDAQRRTLKTGPLTLEIKVDAEGRLCSVTLPKKVPTDLDAATLSQTLTELGKFSLAPEGAAFTQKVWAHMAKIPWGSALTYGELAAKAGSPKATRAVGNACATNPLPLIVPCHRVLANEGLGGFAYGPEWKMKLLELESEPRP